MPPYRDCKYTDCRREKELVAPVRPQNLQVAVWSWPLPSAYAKEERILGMCQCPATPKLRNHKALARTEPLQMVTMTPSVDYVPESTSQIIISTQGKDTVYKELSSQTMLFEV